MVKVTNGSVLWWTIRWWLANRCKPDILPRDLIVVDVDDEGFWFNWRSRSGEFLKEMSLPMKDKRARGRVYPGRILTWYPPVRRPAPVSDVVHYVVRREDLAA